MYLGDGQDNAKTSPKDCTAGLCGQGWLELTSLFDHHLLHFCQRRRIIAEKYEEAMSCEVQHVALETLMAKLSCDRTSVGQMSRRCSTSQSAVNKFGRTAMGQSNNPNWMKWGGMMARTFGCHWIKPCDNVNQWQISRLPNKLVYRANKTEKKSSCTALVAEGTRPSVHV